MPRFVVLFDVPLSVVYRASKRLWWAEPEHGRADWLVHAAVPARLREKSTRCVDPAVAGNAPVVPDEPEVPRLNGIPIGDCREPTADEQAALGCPQSPPIEGVPCDFARGASCAYSLGTDRGDAYQNLYFCSNDAEQQWSLTQEQCGYVCTDVGPKVLEFDVANCATREEHSCQREGFVYGYAPSGYRRMSDMLSEAIRHCAPVAINFGASLELAHGCAKHFSTSYAFSQAALACIRERFESLRYACAEQAPCVYFSAYFADGP